MLKITEIVFKRQEKRKIYREEQTKQKNGRSNSNIPIMTLNFKGLNTEKDNS